VDAKKINAIEKQQKTLFGYPIVEYKDLPVIVGEIILEDFNSYFRRILSERRKNWKKRKSNP